MKCSTAIVKAMFDKLITTYMKYLMQLYLNITAVTAVFTFVIPDLTIA